MKWLTREQPWSHIFSQMRGSGKTSLYGRACRQYAPLTLCTVFKEERMTFRPPLTLSTIFDRVELGHPTPHIASVQKPPGEVARPGRGGFTLAEATSIPRKEYNNILVSLSLRIYKGWLFTYATHRKVQEELLLSCSFLKNLSLVRKGPGGTKP